MPLNIHELKVNQTALPIGTDCLLVSNINIPEAYLQDIDPILNRVQTFIVQDYINTPNVHFQVCATYDLRHSQTGAIKTWTGSFNPRGNELNALNGFQLYSANFQNVVREACSDDNIYRKLRLFHVDTHWVFDRLVSVYINIQAIVPNNHPTIGRRQLAPVRRHGQTQRAQETFLLP